MFRYISTVLVPNRQQIFIATKFGFVDNQRGGLDLNLTPERTGQACKDSLRRLGIETIDLYCAHRIDPAVPVEEIDGGDDKPLGRSGEGTVPG